MQFEYFINLDERGDFFADVRNPEGETVYELHGFDVFEDGYMKHKYDLDGLLDYLFALNILGTNDTIVRGNK